MKKYEFCASLALLVEKSIALNYLQQSLMHAGAEDAPALNEDSTYALFCKAILFTSLPEPSIAFHCG